MLQPQIIARTDSWLVVAKPAGWLSIPGRDGPDGRPNPNPVLSDWARDQESIFDPKCTEIWVVHRLDLETSGVILFARSASAHRQANQWFEKHQVKKTYECLAQGIPGTPVLRIDTPIEDQRALSQVEVRERLGAAGFLGRVRIVTGRRHQIRIHLSSIGHPLWGDVRYGGPSSVETPSGGLKIERVALHSAQLELPTGEKYQAPLPEDFRRWAEQARGSLVSKF